MKILAQLAIMILFFLTTWFLLSRIDFIKIGKVNENKDKLESKLGELVLESIKSHGEEITDSTLVNKIQDIVDKITDANNIKKDKVKLHILDATQVNAFALPDDHLVIYSELLKEATRVEEIAGVIAHELAHIEENHVMRKILSEFGFSALSNLAGGGTLGEVQKLLTSQAYSRSLETEADEVGLSYLIEAKIDPSGLADFLYKMTLQMQDVPQLASWLSTHPDSEERSNMILEALQQDSTSYEAMYSDSTWQEFQKVISEY